MKKLVALAAAAVISSAAVFAENTFHFGLYFPISSFTVQSLTDDDFDDLALFTTGVGGSVDFTHVADSGFVFKVGMGLAAAFTDDILTYEGDDFSGTDFEMGLGLGGSFIHNERMTLSLTGNFGYRIQSFSESGSEKIYGTKTKYDNSWTSVLFYVGPELSFTYRFNEHFGIFASVGVFANIGATINDYKVENKDFDIDEEDTDGYFTTGSNFQPKIGVSITL
jgi:hypothetical protein